MSESTLTYDFRSDTCTRPTPEMRSAIANAEVGDDVYGEVNLDIHDLEAFGDEVEPGLPLEDGYLLFGPDDEGPSSDCYMSIGFNSGEASSIPADASQGYMDVGMENGSDDDLDDVYGTVGDTSSTGAMPMAGKEFGSRNEENDTADMGMGFGNRQQRQQQSSFRQQRK